MDPAEVVAADELLGDRLSSSVRVTTWSLSQRTPRLTCSRISSRHGEHRGDLVGDDLGRVEVAGVEAEQLLARDGVAEVELVRADDVALRAEAEQLALDRVEVVLAGRSARRRSRRATAASRSRGPLRSTGVSLMPSGIQTLVTQGDAQRLADRRADLPAGDAVVDPELADRRRRDGPG